MPSRRRLLVETFWYKNNRQLKTHAATETTTTAEEEDDDDRATNDQKKSETISRSRARPGSRSRAKPPPRGGARAVSSSTARTLVSDDEISSVKIPFHVFGMKPKTHRLITMERRCHINSLFTRTHHTASTTREPSRASLFRLHTRARRRDSSQRPSTREEDFSPHS